MEQPKDRKSEECFVVETKRGKFFKKEVVVSLNAHFKMRATYQAVFENCH